MAVEDKESGWFRPTRAGVLYMCTKINVNNCVIIPSVGNTNSNPTGAHTHDSSATQHSLSSAFYIGLPLAVA